MQAAYEKFAKSKAGKDMTSKEATEWFTAAKIIGKGKCNSNDLDIQYTAVKKQHGKGKFACAEVKPLLEKMKKNYAADKKIPEDEAVTKMEEALKSADNIKKGTETSKTGGVGRMTDASKYTGAHKERFDADGKGKGAEGRTDKVENTGYTGQYKGQDTYSTKK